MSLLNWVDNRTLLGCDLIIAAIYTCAFLTMRRFYPRLRGTGSFAISYALVSAGCLLFVAPDNISFFISVVVANAFLFASCVFFLRGILRLFDIKKTTYVATSWSILATLLLAYFTVVHNDMVARAAIFGCTIFLLRGLVAVEVFRQSSRRPIIRLFSYVTGLCAVLGLSQAITAFVFGAPANLMQFDARQTFALIVSTAFICILGLFLIFMLSSELLDRVEDESQQDFVTGTLNRRAIELKLALELTHVGRSGQNLSVAFIDIDHFKHINDFSGHASGDDALRQVSAAISNRLRAYDLLGRYGGDEFLVVLPQASWSDTLIVCQRLERAIRKISVDGKNLATSTGITQAIPGELPVSLLARADKALYAAKNSGRDHSRVILHDPLSDSDPTDSSSYIAIPRDDEYPDAPESSVSTTPAPHTTLANQ